MAARVWSLGPVGAPIVRLLTIAAAAAAGCDAILGIAPHPLAEAGPPDGGRPGPGAGDGGSAAFESCGDSGVCVLGGLLSVARVPGDVEGDGGGARLPDGAPVTLTDDGFELGTASCDTTGTTCVTGGISP